MKRPMTSPWSAVLTSSATITLTPNSAAFARASCAPEISLWSVIAIAPSPASRALASSTSTGVAQSLEWSVCMCRSTSISGRAGEPGAHRGVALGRVAARGDLGVDRLEALRDARPVEVVVRALRARAQARAQAVVADQALELRGERLDVAGLEQQPEVVVAADDLGVGAQVRGDRHRAGAERAHEQARRGRDAVRGGDDDVGRREHRVLGRVLLGEDVHAVEQPRADRSARRPRGRTRSPPSRAPSGSRRSARRNSRSARALLLVDERDPHAAVVRRRAAAASAPGRRTR